MVEVSVKYARDIDRELRTLETTSSWKGDIDYPIRIQKINASIAIWEWAKEKQKQFATLNQNEIKKLNEHLIRRYKYFLEQGWIVNDGRGVDF